MLRTTSISVRSFHAKMKLASAENHTALAVLSTLSVDITCFTLYVAISARLNDIIVIKF